MALGPPHCAPTAVPAVPGPPYLAAPAPRRWKCLRGNAVCGDGGGGCGGRENGKRMEKEGWR